LKISTQGRKVAEAQSRYSQAVIIKLSNISEAWKLDIICYLPLEIATKNSCIIRKLSIIALAVFFE